MDYSAIINYALSFGSVLLFVVAALVIVTTIITEVIKKVFPKVPANILALCTAMIVTVLAVIILCVVLESPIMWYYIVGAVMLGFAVAYAAMFGFDKFKEIVQKLNQFKKLE